MAKIELLEKQVAELIAAGEVVERPASIVKELIENSVDAGATAITAEIHGGGINYLRVTDNGGGIPREDVGTAFLRHATSKIKTGNDLESIMTMGFRGEALASVAAMCRVELLTRTAGETAGTRYEIFGGEQQSCEDAGCPVGTTITVRDIFYNTPARMKFLKKDVSEGNSVAAVLEKLALANPNVAVKFIRDGSAKLQTPGDGKLISAVRCTLGREAAENMISVSYELDGLSINGLISRPSFAKGSRAMQNFFINTRFVRSKTCMAALEEAYRNAIMAGKFPSCVLNLTIPPQTVDVNVHPAKIEVRFSDEKSIFSLVYYGCKTALGAGGLEPELKLAEKPHNPFEQQSQSGGEQLRMSAAQYRDTFCEQSERPGQRVPWDARPPASGTAYKRRGWIDISADDEDNVQAKTGAGRAGFSSASTGLSAGFSGTEQPRDRFPIASVDPFEEFSGADQPRDGFPIASIDPFEEFSGADQPRDGFPIASVDPFEAFSGGVPRPEGFAAPPDVTTGDMWQGGAFGNEVREREAACEVQYAATAHKIDPYENAVQLGEAFGTYIILEGADDLLFIDKHAAHERLIFNRLMSHGVGDERQILLTPVSVRLSQEEHAAVIENLPLLERAGITAEDFGDGHVIVRELAPILTGIDIEGTLTELAVKLMQSGGEMLPKKSGGEMLPKKSGGELLPKQSGGEMLPKQLENLYHTVACRAAIKAHDKTSPEALSELISMLRADGDAEHCPHGRPVCVRLSRRELEKRFGRLG